MKTEFKLQPEAKAKWVAALRSGKYKQGVGELKQVDDNGETLYCCLGVARELKLARKTSREELLSFEFVPETVQRHLADLNDDYLKSFPEIAAERAESARLLQFTAEQSAVAITAAVEDERTRNCRAVMDLCLGLEEIGGTPRLVDLINLAKRIRGNK